MKTILLFTACLASCHFGFGQRQMDLKIEVLANQNVGGQLIQSIKIINDSAEDLLLTDSLKMSATYNGNVVFFPPSLNEFGFITNKFIPAGNELYLYDFFNFVPDPNSPIDADFQLCYTLIPHSTSNPIVDLNPSDNVSCLTSLGNVAISDVKLKPLTFYPNPIQDRISFNETIASVQLFSLDGRIICGVQNKQELFVGDLPRGMYILQMQSGNQFLMKQVLLN